MADYQLNQPGATIQQAIDKALEIEGELQTEIAAREAADDLLATKTALQAEVTARQNADDLKADATALTAEAQRAEAAEQALAGRATAIEGKIPTAASAQNQLADKAYVNDSVTEASANYISYNDGPFPSVADLNAYTGPHDKNDYAYVVSTDSAGNTIYSRYKFNGTTWVKEYDLNNSSFTSAQWATINSGMVSTDKTKIDGVAAGAQVNIIESVKVNGTALTPASKAVNVEVPTALADLAEDTTHRVVTDTEKTTWGGKYAKPSGGIPKTDLSSEVQASLGKADSAYQKPDSGIPASDLATGVIPDISGKVNTSDIVDNVTTDNATKPLSAKQGKVLNDNLTQLGQEVDNIEDAVNANSETTPTYTVTSGKYVASNGVLSDNSSFSKTSKFAVLAGDTVIFDGRGNSSIAVIAKTNEGETSYTALVLGQSNSQDNVYSYKFTEDSYAVVSYYRLNSLKIKNADNVTILKGRVDNIDATLPTLQTKANLVTGISEQSTNDTYPGAKAVFDYSKKANDVAGKLNPLLDTFDLLHPYAIFNGTNSAASITQVDLTSNGDFLEMELFPDASIESPYAYGLVNWDVAQVSVGASQTNIWVRGHDSSRTWVASGVSIGGTKAHYILKVLFDDNKIKIYVDGTLIHTYNGQVPISLKYWGLYFSGGSYYWKGKIGYINVSGNVSYITELPGYTGNIKLETDHGFLTEGQAAQLDQASVYPNIIVSATSSSVDVYNKVHDNIYAKFTINHQVDTATGQYKYKDLWRIASQGDVCVYDGESFASLGVKLLVSAENEFAIKFAGFLDFTGGYHGYERIDLDSSCYVVFCLDGKEYGIADLVTLGTWSGASFEYRQKALCYTDSGYSESPIHFANHVKRTRFENGGFVTRNYLEVILDDLSVSSLTAESAFEGLVCVSEDCADKVVGVDGTIYPTTHPSTSAILVNNINKTSRFVKMFNGSASCCLDSKLIGATVAGYAQPGNRVQIMDRADDAKYYSYLPSNIAWSDGDAIEVECSVKYDYNQPLTD